MLISDKVKLFSNLIKNANKELLQQLSGLPSFNQRIKFCNTNFQKLKAGSSRIAYNYDENHVLKLAKNNAGIAQNSTESDGFIQQGYKSIVANVIDSDPNDLWLIVQKAYKAKQSDFQFFANISFNDFCAMIKAELNFQHFTKPNNYAELIENEFLQEILNLANDYNMPAGDLCRISSYGKVNNKLVLIDYGFTKSIADEYYK